MTLSIYLAGPISKCTLDQAIGWRNQVKQSLAQYFDGSEIVIYDPLRGKEAELKKRFEYNPSNNNNPVIGHNYNCPGILSNPHIFTRDCFDIDRSDILLVNLSDTSKLSVGTLFEIGYGYAKGKTIFVVMHQDSWLQEHPFIEQSSLLFFDLQDAVDAIVEYQA